MISTNVLAIVSAALAIAGTSASPCKPTTTTSAATTSTSSAAATSTTSACTPLTELPQGEPCGYLGFAVSIPGSNIIIDTGDESSLQACLGSCTNKPGCAAIAFREDNICVHLTGEYSSITLRPDASGLAWYDLGCFCPDESRQP